MSESNTEFWDMDSIEVDENGFVQGQAYKLGIHGQFDVTASVTSYEYERNGETKMNHVPHIVVSEKDGKIIKEPHANDSENPKKQLKTQSQQLGM